MHDVVVYLSSLPRIADRNRKVETLRSFAQGAQSKGARVFVQQAYEILPAKLAVILGWVGTKISGQHIQLRRRVIDHQTEAGQRIMSIDGSCFKYADPASMYLRYSLDGVYYNQNIYANHGSDQSKWQQVQKDLALEFKEYRSNGQHILVCLQRDGGWSMKGVDLRNWALHTVKRLRQLTDRPILVRPHPKNPVADNLFAGISGIEISYGTTLCDDLRGAWASVFFNSSSAVASVMAGIPVFALDDDCVAWNVANHDLAMIEAPAMPDRQQWLWDLCAAHWTDDESRAGLIYNKFQQYL